MMGELYIYMSSIVYIILILKKLKPALSVIYPPPILLFRSEQTHNELDRYQW